MTDDPCRVWSEQEFAQMRLVGANDNKVCPGLFRNFQDFLVNGAGGDQMPDFAVSLRPEDV